MSKKIRVGDAEEIYGKEPHKKKGNKFREHGHSRVRDFKRNYSQEQDREDLNVGGRYR